METFLKKKNLVVKPTLLKSMVTAVSHSLCALEYNPLIFTPHNPYLHNIMLSHTQIHFSVQPIQEITSTEKEVENTVAQLRVDTPEKEMWLEIWKVYSSCT